MKKLLKLLRLTKPDKVTDATISAKAINTDISRELYIAKDNGVYQFIYLYKNKPTRLSNGNWIDIKNEGDFITPSKLINSMIRVDTEKAHKIKITIEIIKD